ncbi:hypothetical protein KY289_001669 [Solanum tuberosum]|nr:hypothetical protein KY289_001669 [Solanum tuberosum]
MACWLKGRSNHTCKAIYREEPGPLKEESSSTPVCGVGETSYSVTPHTEVMASPALHSGEILPYSPTLVLSSEKSQNLRPNIKGTESNILAAAEEFVAVQSLASLRGDIQPTLLEQELRSAEQVPHSTQYVFDQTPKSFDVDSEEEEEEETHLVWRRKGVRGANAMNLTVLDPEAIVVVSEAKPDDEPTESEMKRKNGRFSKQRRKKKEICDQR